MTHGFASFSALMSCILSSTNICCCAASSCGAAEPHTCLFFPTHHGDAMGRRHGPAPHGLESDVISLEWRSLSWAFCHFYIILQYQRVQARALKQAGRHKREPVASGRLRSPPVASGRLRSTSLAWRVPDGGGIGPGAAWVGLVWVCGEIAARKRVCVLNYLSWVVTTLAGAQNDQNKAK